MGHEDLLGKGDIPAGGVILDTFFGGGVILGQVDFPGGGVIFGGGVNLCRGDVLGRGVFWVA